VQRDNASIIVPTCRLSGLCQKRGKPEEAESNVISAVALRIPVSIPENTPQTTRSRIPWKPTIALTDTDNSPGAPTDHRMRVRPSQGAYLWAAEANRLIQRSGPPPWRESQPCTQVYSNKSSAWSVLEELNPSDARPPYAKTARFE